MFNIFLMILMMMLAIISMVEDAEASLYIQVLTKAGLPQVKYPTTMHPFQMNSNNVQKLVILQAALVKYIITCTITIPIRTHIFITTMSLMWTLMSSEILTIIQSHKFV